MLYLSRTAFALVVFACLQVAYGRNAAARHTGYDFAADYEDIVGKVEYNFNCTGLAYGYYADQLHDCKVFHICSPVTPLAGRPEQTFMFSFFCPNHTRFSQDSKTCIDDDHAYPCELAHTLYHENDKIGQYERRTRRPPTTDGRAEQDEGARTSSVPDRASSFPSSHRFEHPSPTPTTPSRTPSRKVQPIQAKEVTTEAPEQSTFPPQQPTQSPQVTTTPSRISQARPLSTPSTRPLSGRRQQSHSPSISGSVLPPSLEDHLPGKNNINNVPKSDQSRPPPPERIRPPTAQTPVSSLVKGPRDDAPVQSELKRPVSSIGEKDEQSPGISSVHQSSRGVTRSRGQIRHSGIQTSSLSGTKVNLNEKTDSQISRTRGRVSSSRGVAQETLVDDPATRNLNEPIDSKSETPSLQSTDIRDPTSFIQSSKGIDVNSKAGRTSDARVQITSTRQQVDSHHASPHFENESHSKDTTATSTGSRRPTGGRTHKPSPVVQFTGQIGSSRRQQIRTSTQVPQEQARQHSSRPSSLDVAGKQKLTLEQAISKIDAELVIYGQIVPPLNEFPKTSTSSRRTFNESIKLHKSKSTPVKQTSSLSRGTSTFATQKEQVQRIGSTRIAGTTAVSDKTTSTAHKIPASSQGRQEIGTKTSLTPEPVHQSHTRFESETGSRVPLSHTDTRNKINDALSAFDQELVLSGKIIPPTVSHKPSPIVQFSGRIGQGQPRVPARGVTSSTSRGRRPQQSNIPSIPDIPNIVITHSSSDLSDQEKNAFIQKLIKSGKVSVPGLPGLQQSRPVALDHTNRISSPRTVAPVTQSAPFPIIPVKQTSKISQKPVTVSLSELERNLVLSGNIIPPTRSAPSITSAKPSPVINFTGTVGTGQSTSPASKPRFPVSNIRSRRPQTRTRVSQTLLDPATGKADPNYKISVKHRVKPSTSDSSQETKAGRTDSNFRDAIETIDDSQLTLNVNQRIQSSRTGVVRTQTTAAIDVSEHSSSHEEIASQEVQSDLTTARRPATSGKRVVKTRQRVTSISGDSDRSTTGSSSARGQQSFRKVVRRPVSKQQGTSVTSKPTFVSIPEATPRPVTRNRGQNRFKPTPIFTQENIFDSAKIDSPTQFVPRGGQRFQNQNLDVKKVQSASRGSEPAFSGVVQGRRNRGRTNVIRTKINGNDFVRIDDISKTDAHEQEEQQSKPETRDFDSFDVVPELPSEPEIKSPAVSASPRTKIVKRIRLPNSQPAPVGGQKSTSPDTELNRTTADKPRIPSRKRISTIRKVTVLPGQNLGNVKPINTVPIEDRIVPPSRVILTEEIKVPEETPIDLTNKHSSTSSIRSGAQSSSRIVNGKRVFKIVTKIEETEVEDLDSVSTAKPALNGQNARVFGSSRGTTRVTEPLNIQQKDEGLSATPRRSNVRRVVKLRVNNNENKLPNSQRNSVSALAAADDQTFSRTSGRRVVASKVIAEENINQLQKQDTSKLGAVEPVITSSRRGGRVFRTRRPISQQTTVSDADNKEKTETETNTSDKGIVYRRPEDRFATVKVRKTVTNIQDTENVRPTSPPPQSTTTAAPARRRGGQGRGSRRFGDRRRTQQTVEKIEAVSPIEITSTSRTQPSSEKTVNEIVVAQRVDAKGSQSSRRRGSRRFSSRTRSQDQQLKEVDVSLTDSIQSTKNNNDLGVDLDIGLPDEQGSSRKSVADDTGLKAPASVRRRVVRKKTPLELKVVGTSVKSSVTQSTSQSLGKTLKSVKKLRLSPSESTKSDSALTELELEALRSLAQPSQAPSPTRASGRRVVRRRVIKRREV